MPALAPQPLTAPVARLLAHLANPVAPRRLIGLVGLPGAGKSTVAQQWADQVNLAASAPVMVALSMDGFHLSKAQLARFDDPAEAFKRRGAPWTFDPTALAVRLQALRVPGARVMWPGFEHGVGDPVADAVSIAPSTRLVLVEGLYLLHQGHGWDHAAYFDECWFLEVPMAVAMARLLKRHRAANHQTLEVAQARLAGNDQLNAQMVWQSRARANWCVVPGT